MKALRKYTFEPDYAVPPGATLAETMEALEMTQKELATRTGLTVQTLNRIFKGEQPITVDTANKLELVTGTPAAFWNNLETQYRQQLAKIQQAKEMEADREWLKTIPVKELIKRKAIPDVTDEVILVRESFRFYGVSSAATWHDLWDEPQKDIAARRCPFFESKPGPTSAWLRLGQIEARNIECAPYDKAKFQENLRAIRALTVLPPEEFIPELRRLCAEAGVALVLVPEIKGAPWSGASQWLTPSKAMIVLNLRGKSEDRFWFSFFHEASHILHDSKKQTYIDDGKSYRESPEEKKADGYAAEFLIPASYNARIKEAKSASNIRELGSELKISPGIVAGRFQHLTRKWSYFRDLIKTFDWEKKN